MLAGTLVAGGGEPGSAPRELRVGVLRELTARGPLAATNDGGLLAVHDATANAIVAFPPLTATGLRTVVSGFDRTRPEAIAFIDEGMLAAVCREGGEWWLRTWKLEPGGPVDQGTPFQSISLGRADARPDVEAGGVVLGVGLKGRWLVVAGLPAPLEPVLRGVIVGGRIGPLSSRRCPRPEADTRPVAVTVGPLDELVLVERRSPPATGDIVSFHGPGGECLLRLDSGLSAIRGIASLPGERGLWAVAAEPAAAGLWRLDAALDRGRQVIRPNRVLPLTDPGSIVALGETGLAVDHVGPAGRRVSGIDLGEPPADETSGDVDDAQGGAGTAVDSMGTRR